MGVVRIESERGERPGEQQQDAEGLAGGPAPKKPTFLQVHPLSDGNPTDDTAEFGSGALYASAIAHEEAGSLSLHR